MILKYLFTILLKVTSDIQTILRLWLICINYSDHSSNEHPAYGNKLRLYQASTITSTVKTKVKKNVLLFKILETLFYLFNWPQKLITHYLCKRWTFPIKEFWTQNFFQTEMKCKALPHSNLFLMLKIPSL